MNKVVTFLILLSCASGFAEQTPATVSASKVGYTDLCKTGDTQDTAQANLETSLKTETLLCNTKTNSCITAPLQVNGSVFYPKPPATAANLKVACVRVQGTLISK